MIDALLKTVEKSEYEKLRDQFGDEAAEFFADRVEDTSGYHTSPTGLLTVWGTSDSSKVIFPISIYCLGSISVVSLVDDEPVCVVRSDSTGFVATKPKIKYVAIGYVP